MNMIPLTPVDLHNAGVIFPEVKIADETIDQADIALEIQHHPHESLEEAWTAAARSLVIKRLLEIRADALGLIEEDEAVRTATLLEKELEVPEPDEGACERYYEQNKSRFKTSSLLAVRHILLASAPDDQEGRDAGRVESENIIHCLKKSPSEFEQFALNYSACESKHLGGQLGQISKGQTVSEFERQIKDLPVGLHTSPIESRYGWHVVVIDNRVEGEQLPYEAVKTHIHQMLQESVTRRCLKQYLQMLATQANVEGIDMGQKIAHY
jgi:peptidyl-prolyl cis-trans isomerase C